MELQGLRQQRLAQGEGEREVSSEGGTGETLTLEAWFPRTPKTGSSVSEKGSSRQVVYKRVAYYYLSCALFFPRCARSFAAFVRSFAAFVRSLARSTPSLARSTPSLARRPLLRPPEGPLGLREGPSGPPEGPLGLRIGPSGPREGPSGPRRVGCSSSEEGCVGSSLVAAAWSCCSAPHFGQKLTASSGSSSPQFEQNLAVSSGSSVPHLGQKLAASS